MKLKTHKAASKRLKITKTGKVLKRAAGQDHFRSRKSGEKTRLTRSDVTLSPSFHKTVETVMPGTRPKA